MPFDVVVVGGGVAGLAAATRLAEAGAPTLVLEASKVAGGRARSWTDPATGQVIDNGQHLFMGCYEQTLSFLERIGTRHLVRFQDRLRIDFADAHGPAGTIDCPPLPGSLSLLVGLALDRTLSAADRIGFLRVVRDLQARRERRTRDSRGHEGGSERWELGSQLGTSAEGDGSAGSDAADESCESYLKRVGQTARARRNFWDPLILATLNDRPEIASARTLRRVLEIGFMAGSAAARLGWATVGLEDLYAGPAGTFLGERGGELRTSCPVSCVEPGGDYVEIALRSGATIRARAVVMAVPPSVLLRLVPDKLSASNAFRHLSSFRASPILGVNLWLDRPIMEAPFVGLLGTTMHWLFNKGQLLDSGEEGRGSYLALVVSGARREIDLSAEELVKLALADLRAVFPAARSARLQRSLVVKERQATISPAVGWDLARPGAATIEPRLFLAGDWTGTGLPATIESAAMSGHIAAEKALGVLG